MPFNSLAEEPLQYEAGKDSVLDACLTLSYEQVSQLALTWRDAAQVAELYDPELSASYSDDDIKHPYKVFVLYPTDAFDPLFSYKQAGMDTDAFSEAAIAWQSIGNVNMRNETGQSRPSVKQLSASVNLLAC